MSLILHSPNPCVCPCALCACITQRHQHQHRQARGIAFVSFVSAGAVLQAVALDNDLFGDRNVKVKKAAPNTQQKKHSDSDDKPAKAREGDYWKGQGGEGGGAGGGVCFDFKRGACTRGAACRFAHDNDTDGGDDDKEAGKSLDTSKRADEGNGRHREKGSFSSSAGGGTTSRRDNRRSPSDERRRHRNRSYSNERRRDRSYSRERRRRRDRDNDDRGESRRRCDDDGDGSSRRKGGSPSRRSRSPKRQKSHRRSP